MRRRRAAKISASSQNRVTSDPPIHLEKGEAALILPLTQRPEWRADPRALTFLETDRPDRFAAKQWVEGLKSPISYARVKHWHPFVALPNDIESLSKILLEAADRPRLAVIRGAVLQSSINKEKVNRRVRQKPGEPQPDIEDVPRLWIMVDLDSVPEPTHFNWREDLVAAAIWASDRYLPEIFQNCAFFYHYSASAGLKSGLRLHFWFWLEAPVNSADAKRYMRSVPGIEPDLSLYNPVQPHYTASPIFRGVKDPLPAHRGGLVLSANGSSRKRTVTIPIIGDSLRREQTSEGATADLSTKRLSNKRPYRWTIEAAKDALRYIDPGVGREDWRKVIVGLMTEFGKSKDIKELAKAWSSGQLYDGKPPVNYDEAENERQWESFQPNHNSMGRLYQLAREGGWKSSRFVGQNLILIDSPSKTMAKEVFSGLLEQEAEHQTLFRYGRSLARVGSEIEVLIKDELWQLLSSRLKFARMDRKGSTCPCDPPTPLVTYIMNSPPAEIPLPELLGVTHAPVMALNGSICTAQGYSPVSKLFHFPSVDVGSIPDEPTVQQVSNSRQMLEEVICDFPFVDESDRAHALSLMILPFVRSIVAGPTPIYLLNKPTQGTGATLLGEIITLIKTGHPLAATNAPRSEEEWQKKILAKLLTAPEFFFVDNVTTIYSEALATVLTTDVYEGRKLGVSEIVRVPVRCVWIMTGNNPDLSPDFPRRMIDIRLDANSDNPAEGRAFRHPKLKEWVSSHRGDLIAAILTLARAWVAAGKPKPEATRASFEDWAWVVGGILQVAGIKGFLRTPEDRNDLEGPRAEAERGFVRCWLGHVIDDRSYRRSKAGTLFKMATSQGLEFAAGARGNEHGQVTQFGIRLARLRDKTFRVFGFIGLPEEVVPEIQVKIVRVGPSGDAYWCLEVDEAKLAKLKSNQFLHGVAI